LGASVHCANLGLFECRHETDTCRQGHSTYRVFLQLLLPP
jgi:hypothetical protein